MADDFDQLAVRAMYNAVKHSGPGLVADAVRYVYVRHPERFEPIGDIGFHTLMTGTGEDTTT